MMKVKKKKPCKTALHSEFRREGGRERFNRSPIPRETSMYYFIRGRSALPLLDPSRSPLIWPDLRNVASQPSIWQHSAVVVPWGVVVGCVEADKRPASLSQRQKRGDVDTRNVKRYIMYSRRCDLSAWSASWSVRRQLTTVRAIRSGRGFFWLALTVQPIPQSFRPRRVHVNGTADENNENGKSTTSVT